MTPRTVGISLKMYLGFRETLVWAAAVDRAVGQAKAAGNDLEVFIVPSFPALTALALARSLRHVSLAAQNCHHEAAGAFTGEVAVTQLQELGIDYVEVGHAERARYFGETRAEVSQKVQLICAAGMIPVVCVGEWEKVSPELAADEVIRDLEQMLTHTTVARGSVQRMVVAYEPVWAIGAATAAAADHVNAVLAQVRTWLHASDMVEDFSLIYGGSAQAGTFTGISGTADGLFLGRFAHDVTAFKEILAEIGAGQLAG